MNNTFNKLIAKGSAIALIASSLVTALPARAAITVATDVMTNSVGSPVQAVNAAGVTHTVTLTSDAAVSDGDFTLTYPAGFTAMTDGAGADSCAGGTLTFDSSTANTITYTTAGCGAGDLVMVFTATNPATAGSYPVILDAGTTDLDDGAYFAVPITNDDQIDVTATVDPYITFQVTASGTACSSGTDTDPDNHTPSSDGGTVAFGSLSPTAVSSSDSNSPAGGAIIVSPINHICTTVSTNAADGYFLQVSSLNASLESGANNIDSASGNLTAGTEGYGLCYVAASHDQDTVGTATWTAEAAYDDCTGNSVGILANAFNTIGGTDGPVQESSAMWWLQASISGTTPAGVYTDTLTFTATGTF